MITKDQLQQLQRYCINWRYECEEKDDHGDFILYEDLMRIIDPNYIKEEKIQPIAPLGIDNTGDIIFNTASNPINKFTDRNSFNIYN